MPRMIKTRNGFFHRIKYILEVRNGGFRINISPYGYLTHVTSGNYANSIVNKVFTLFTLGWIHRYNKIYLQMIISVKLLINL